MNCAITQPSYIPWRGHFHLIQKADVFVFFDDVQYTRKSWRNRNRVEGDEKARWLTIPVSVRDHQARRVPIKEVEIDWSRDWNLSHRRILHQAYRKAPHYRRFEPLLDEIFSQRPRLLADFTIETTIALARALDLGDTRFVRSSELEPSGTQTDRVISLMKQVGATHLINGPTARDYTDHEKLEAAALSVEYMTYDYGEYPQLRAPFDPHLSVLDLLLMTGRDAGSYIWEQPKRSAGLCT